MGVVEWALIAIHSMLWGSAFFFGAVAIKEIPPLTITAFRLIPACLVVLAVVLLAGHRVPWNADYWRRMFALGALNNFIPLMLILWAQYQVASGIAAVFNATAPLFAVVIAHFATRDERLSARKIAGVMAGIAGVAILVGVDFAASRTGGLLPKIALLGAALSYALAGVYARRTAREAPFVIAIGQMATVLVMAMPLSLLFDRPWLLPPPSAAAVWAVLGMGLFGSALAALVYFTVLKRAGATNTLLVTLLLPLTPILLGAAFLGESLSHREFAGAAMIGLALIILHGRLPRLLARRLLQAER
jgi:drug/metabolite transporter (DMT)-like permease